MKPYINFLIIILVAVAAYTAYGLFTFQVDEPRPFVFNEPKLPAELIQMDEANATPDAKQRTIAVEEAQKALTYYRGEQKKAPKQVDDTIALLVDRMTNSDLPLYFLSTPSEQNAGKRIFQMLNIDSSHVIDPSGSSTKQVLNCSSKVPVATMIVGTSGKDAISCDAVRGISGTTKEADYLFVGGPEDDTITDMTGNRVVNGGTGNDTISLGAGRSIIILDASWGNDVLTIDCSGANIVQNEIPTGFSIPWIYKTTNFIVLGNSINSKDVYWNGNALTHRVTGDTLTVNQKCFTVVPSVE